MTSNTTIGIDGNNSLKLDDAGNLYIAYNAEAVAQACTRAMSTLLGELQFNAQNGVDYMGTVFASGQDGIAQFISSATAALSKVTGIERVAYFDASFENDTLTYTAKLLSVYGELTVNSVG